MASILGYTCVSYPESMPSDYLTRLNQLENMYMYALHDKDKTKPHIHWMFIGKMTNKQKEYVAQSLGISCFFKDLRSPTGMYDYFTHENNEDKYHYSRDIIQQSANWSQEAFEDICDSQLEPSKQILKTIQKYNILEFSDLVDWAIEQPSEKIYADLLRREVFYKHYIDSKRYNLDIDIIEINRDKTIVKQEKALKLADRHIKDLNNKLLDYEIEKQTSHILAFE